MYNYSEAFMKLGQETAIVTFIKKNGVARVMLCTRNPHTIRLACNNQYDILSSHDKRCNIDNKNIAVIDLILGEARAFNIERLTSLTYFGTINDTEEYNKITDVYFKFKSMYEKYAKEEANMGGAFSNVIDTTKITEEQVNKMFDVAVNGGGENL